MKCSNRREAIYRTEVDRRSILGRLADVPGCVGVEIHTVVLMVPTPITRV